MATPRLPFLWPMLFRPLKASRPHSRISSRKVQSHRTFITSAPRYESRPQRYGTAQEPEPHLRKESELGILDTAPKSATERRVEEHVEEEEEEIPRTVPPSTASVNASAEELPPMPPMPPPPPPRTGENKPLETVLHMPSPAEEDHHKPPHLKAPPYVHHFDTYSLVKQLSKGGFSPDQAVTTMKAVRGILTDNMQLAREGLVSKSNVENETYLFKAACSELRTEVENMRKGEIEKSRNERNQLQHEVDILNQRLGQETAHMKDELKGMFDDRKMAVRQEQRHMDSKVRSMMTE